MFVIKVIDRAGHEHRIEAEAGGKVMEILRELEHGVAAICGGMCSCATCHIYVDAEWLPVLPAAGRDERELLAELSHRREESRLSCQIELTPALDGLSVTVAPEE